MTDAPRAYPLAWPLGWPRTAPGYRKHGTFNRKEKRPGESWTRTRDLTVADALRRLQDELDRIGARYPVVSTNVEVRLDGLPRSGQGAPQDPGVAVYFQHKGRPTALPCDRYKTVADNIAAIAAHIEATRAIERHGVGSVEQMFAGFQAIRGPGEKPWREVLGLKGTDQVSRETVLERRPARCRCRPCSAPRSWHTPSPPARARLSPSSPCGIPPRSSASVKRNAPAISFSRLPLGVVAPLSHWLTACDLMFSRRANSEGVTPWRSIAALNSLEKDMLTGCHGAGRGSPQESLARNMKVWVTIASYATRRPSGRH